MSYRSSSPRSRPTEQATIVLFADLDRPQLEGVARIFEEEVIPEGQRVLRQG